MPVQAVSPWGYYSPTPTYYWPQPSWPVMVPTGVPNYLPSAAPSQQADTVALQSQEAAPSTDESPNEAVVEIKPKKAVGIPIVGAHGNKDMNKARFWYAAAMALAVVGSVMMRRDLLKFSKAAATNAGNPAMAMNMSSTLVQLGGLIPWMLGDAAYGRAIQKVEQRPEDWKKAGKTEMIWGGLMSIPLLLPAISPLLGMIPGFGKAFVPLYSKFMTMNLGLGVALDILGSIGGVMLWNGYRDYSRAKQAR